MASKELILCIDIGSDSIKAAEFCLTSNNVVLDRFAYQEYTNDSDDASAFQSMLAALKDVIVANSFESKYVYLSISGQNALIPFIKVPAMTDNPQKIQELVTYEAKSRIPGDFGDVVWDYQLIENDDSADEIDAMLVSVRNSDVIEISKTVMETGKKIKGIEVSPTAIYNSARANGIGKDQCEMVLNIGGKSSTLVFLDGNRFFIRTIPVAGNTITQQIAKEFNMSFSDADDIKRRHGYVALGGAYEEPESTVAATVSKIVRNVMTRLHGEINRSINVYRATQHGRKPEKLYLCGGSSVMAFTPRFFIEKLHIPVDYFNPFEVIPIGDNVNKEDLQELAHLYGEPIGLALRHFRSTPIEISLIPEFIKKHNAFKLKKPFFILSALVLLLYLGVTYWALGEQEGRLSEKLKVVEAKAKTKEKLQKDVNKAKGELEKAEKEWGEAVVLLNNRNGFITTLNGVQEHLADKNIWLSSLSFTDTPAIQAATSDENADEGASTKRRGKGKKNEADQSAAQWLNLTGYVYTPPPRKDESVPMPVDVLRKGFFEPMTEEDFFPNDKKYDNYRPTPTPVLSLENEIISSFTYSLRLNKSTGKMKND